MRAGGDVLPVRERDVRTLVKKLVSSRFVRDVGTVGLGTLAAQAINVLSVLVLSRLYTPAAFGLLGLFYAVTMTVSPAIAAKYDESIVVVDGDENVPFTVNLAILCTLVLSLLCLVVVVAATLVVPEQLSQSSIGSIALLLPVSFALHGLYNVGVYYAVRQQLYAGLSRIKVLQALTVAGANVALFYAGFERIGLVIGLMAGVAVSSFILYRAIGVPVSLAKMKAPVLKVIARRYHWFPSYSAPGAVLNALGYHMPMLAISHFFAQTIAGFYALITRVAFAPLGFLSVAIGHVHVRKVAQLAAAQQPITRYLYAISGAFAAVVALPSLLLIIWGPEIFAFAFGEAWREAGSYLQILMPALALRLIVTTFGGTLEATCNNHLSFGWKLLAFVSTIGVFLWFGPMGDIYLLLKAQLINDLVLYSIFFGLIVWAAAHPRRDKRSDASGRDVVGEL